MSDEKNPFRLEDEPEPPPRPKAPRPLEDEGGGDGPAAASPGPRSPARPPVGAVDPDAVGVDARTLAERTGRAVAPVAERRAPPPGWPLEALRFPVAGTGGGQVVGGAVLWAAFDLVGTGNLFAALLLKLLALPFWVRWQLHVASMSAGGQDQPPRTGAALAMEGEDYRALRNLLLLLVGLGLPGAVAAWAGATGLAVVLLLVASAWFMVALLGASVGDPGLAWPWRALPWIGARPLALLAAAATWWGMGLAEVAAAHLGALSFGLAAVLALLLRALTTWGWLLGGRVLGVVGRSWTPFEDGPEAPGDDSGPDAGGEAPAP